MFFIEREAISLLKNNNLIALSLTELVGLFYFQEKNKKKKKTKNNNKEKKKKEDKEIKNKEEKSKKSKTISKRSSMNENNNINNISKSGMIENNNIENSGMIENKSIEKSGMIENNSNNNHTEEKKDIEIENNKKEKTGMIENNSINNNLNITNLNINSKNKSLILFYNVQGELLKRFVCPCQVNSFSWGNSSTLALAADKYIYIAFAKFKYKWTYLNDTIVFAYLISDQKYNLIFLNTLNDTKQCKLVYNLINVISSDFYCAIIQEAKEKKEY
jgi:hypothetical protein